MTESLLDTTQTDPANYTEALVGEGRKFSSIEDMAKGKYQSDLYVKVLEGQLDRMREDLIKERQDNQLRARVEEYMSNQTQSEQQLTTSAQPTANEVKDKPVDTRQIEDLVASKVRQLDVEKKRTENLNLVKAQLQEQYGSNYQSVLDKAMKDLDLSVEQVNELAKNSPKALLNTLGAATKQTETFQAPPRSSTRSEFKPQGEPERTWSYYQELHKKDKRAFYDPETNVQMLKDAIRLGDKFKDGDYHRFGDS